MLTSSIRISGGIIIIIGMISGIWSTATAQLVLDDGEIRAVINRQTGLIDQLTSLNPTPLQISGEGEGVRFIVVDPSSNVSVEFGKLISLKQYPDRIVATLTCDEPALAESIQVVVTYVLVEDGGLSIRCLVKCLKDIDRPMELLFGQKKLCLDDWYNMAFPAAMGNMDVLTAEQRDLSEQSIGSAAVRSFQRFSDHPDDVTQVPQDVPLKQLRYPYGVLESKDRFLLYGKMDINGYVYLTPNYRGLNPCMMITPKAMQKGQSHFFELTYKFFEKTKYYFTDACRWYAENLYSTNRLTMGIVRLPKDLKPRTFDVPGNVGSLRYYYADKTEADHLAKQKECDDFARQSRMVHMWGGWLEWNEIPTTESSWIAAFGGCPMDEQYVRQELARRHELGYREYAYRRQLFPSLAYSKDSPWKTDWMLRTKPGTVFVCPSGPEPEHRLPYGDAGCAMLEDYIQRELGITIPVPGRMCYVHADFCNDECRKFYLKQLKSWIDKYSELDGFSFDMGWDIHTVPCLAHPDDGQHHGIVNLMAQIYQHVHQRYPHMRIWVNMTLGSPSNLWCDAVMFEGGRGNINYAAVESVKFYRTTMAGWYYPSEYISALGDQGVPTLKYHMRRNLSYGVCLGFGAGAHRWAIYPEFTEIEITDFYQITSGLTNTPLVIENDVLKIEGVDNHTMTAPDITGSVFAKNGVIYIAIFNDKTEATTINAHVNKAYLKPYQPKLMVLPDKSFVFNQDCHLKKTTEFRISDREDSFSITGKLDSKELVILTNYDVDLKGRVSN